MLLTLKGTHKKHFVFFILILFTIALFSSDLIHEYEKRLEESSAYQNLKLQVHSTQQTVGAYSDIFDPYLSLNLQPNGLTFEQVVMDDGDTQNNQTNLNMSADLKLFHLFGTSIGLSLPVQYTSNSEGDSDFIMNSLGLNISRKLISEEQAEKLGVKAQYLKTLHSMEQQEWALFINLVNDVFSQKYYEGLEAVNRKRMEIYSIQFDSAKDEDLKETYEQQKLLALKALLNTEKMLDQISLFTPKDLDSLYEQIKNIIQKMYTDYHELQVSQTSKQIRALELEIEKALAEKKLWFLPYLFNPNLTFKLDYYFDESEKMGFQAGDFKWSIGVSGSLDILDRGEREAAALNRANTYDIKLLELKEEKEQIQKQMNKILLDIDISKVDLQLKEIDYEKNKKDAKKSLELYKQGFITLEEKQLTLLESEQSRLDYIQALHQLYLHQLTLMQESGISFGGYLDEEKE